MQGASDYNMDSQLAGGLMPFTEKRKRRGREFPGGPVG